MRNGSGTYSRAVSAYVYGTIISQTDVNAEMDDIATALTNSLAKNGETTPTANLPMGGYKLTGLGAGTANGDAVRYEQVGLLSAANTFTAQQSFTGTAATAPAIAGASDPNTGVFFPAADTVAVATAGVERMRIDTNGQITGGNSAGSTALALTTTAASVNAKIKLATTSDTSSVAYVLTNSHASINKQASVYLVGANGGLQFQTGQTAGAEPTTGAGAFRIQDDFVGVISPTAGLGYGTGAGGTVTQATSKSTAVTLNKPTGQITVNNSTLGAGGVATFVVNNSLVGPTDTAILSLFNSYTAGAYLYTADLFRAGTFEITVRNLTAGNLSEAIVIQFNIIKGATS